MFDDFIAKYQHTSNHHLIRFNVQSQTRKSTLQHRLWCIDIYCPFYNHFVCITFKSALSWVADESQQNKNACSLLCRVLSFHVCAVICVRCTCLAAIAGLHTAGEGARGQRTAEETHTYSTVRKGLLVSHKGQRTLRRREAPNKTRQEEEGGGHIMTHNPK